MARNRSRTCPLSRLAIATVCVSALPSPRPVFPRSSPGPSTNHLNAPPPAHAHQPPEPPGDSHGLRFNHPSHRRANSADVPFSHIAPQPIHLHLNARRQHTQQNDAHQPSEPHGDSHGLRFNPPSHRRTNSPNVPFSHIAPRRFTDSPARDKSPVPTPAHHHAVGAERTGNPGRIAA